MNAVDHSLADGASPAAELREACARLEAEHITRLTEIAAMPNAIDRAILGGHDTVADNLEKKLVSLRRAERRHALAQPILERSLFDAEGERMRLVTMYRKRAVDACDRVSVALAALVVDNAEADANFAEARGAVGEAAEVFLPRVSHARVSVEAVEAWRQAMEELRRWRN